MSREVPFVIEEVRDLDAVWAELEPLLLGLNDYHSAFGNLELRKDWAERQRGVIEVGPRSTLFLARSGGEPVGFMNARREENLLRDGEHVFIDYAYVRSKARSQGIGIAMLQRVEEWSRAAGIDAIHLGVMVANHEGARFWEKAGFATFLNTMSKRLVDHHD